MSRVRSISRFFQYRCLSESISIDDISDIRASLNHGNNLNGRKYSLSFTKTQKPCCEIFVTSTSKVLFPFFADFIVALFNNFPQLVQFFATITNTMCKFNVWFHPKFCFPVWTNYMHVKSFLFARKKEKPIISVYKNSRTHFLIRKILVCCFVIINFDSLNIILYHKNTNKRT